MSLDAYHYAKRLGLRSELPNGCMHGLFRLNVVALASAACVDNLNPQFRREPQHRDEAWDAGRLGQVHRGLDRDGPQSRILHLALHPGSIIMSRHDVLAHSRNGRQLDLLEARPCNACQSAGQVLRGEKDSITPKPHTVVPSYFHSSRSSRLITYLSACM